ncbi:MAG TPA: Hsp20/alpha crystallin family protein [Actinomycetota bacterium]|nr:Hsp20/alpha crystallin family protein [Actinomycetota bacterium]
MRSSIDRWDPFRDLVSIQDELNRLFGRTFSGSETTRPTASGNWMPSMDVFETEDKIVTEIELPGIDPDQVDVSVEDSTLTVTGSREYTDEMKDENVHRVERRYGAFARAITLPQTADTEKVEARFDKGVLRVEVPKAERAKPKRIEIKAAS